MIISCSRRSDIPAFYSDWFVNRIREGYVMVRNPVNTRQVRRVSLLSSDVDGIVFWTKDPAPMLDKLLFLKSYNFYFQFTLTPYGKDIEPLLPPKAEIIDSFLGLSDEVGSKRIVWRYDPILFSKQITVDYHIDHFGDMARQLSGHTEKCVISFIDMYRHIRNRMVDLSVRAPDKTEMRLLAKNFAKIAGENNMKVETCAEEIDLDDLGIEHGRCIDDGLISDLTGRNPMMQKDKYQRELCGCVTSVDIGEYNSCRHLCQYCYANVSQKKIDQNRSLHNAPSPIADL